MRTEKFIVRKKKLSSYPFFSFRVAKLRTEERKKSWKLKILIFHSLTCCKRRDLAEFYSLWWLALKCVNLNLWAFVSKWNSEFVLSCSIHHTAELPSHPPKRDLVIFLPFIAKTEQFQQHENSTIAWRLCNHLALGTFSRRLIFSGNHSRAEVAIERKPKTPIN